LKKQSLKARQRAQITNANVQTPKKPENKKIPATSWQFFGICCFGVWFFI
jgi:hypothetical protein